MKAGPARRLICLGRIAGLWGLDGWLRIHSYTRQRAEVLDYGSWLIGPPERARRVSVEDSRQPGRGGLVVKLWDVNDRESALGLVGSLIQVTPEQLPALENGEFYWHQLEGLVVETLEGTPLGVVDHLFETGANDVLVVVGDRQRLLPYMPQVVRDVDLESGVMRVDWDADF